MPNPFLSDYLPFGSGCCGGCVESQHQLEEGLCSGCDSLWASALLWSVLLSLYFRLYNFSALFWVLILNEHRPNSALHALFGASLWTLRIGLQKSACRDSIGCSLCSRPAVTPQTSQPCSIVLFLSRALKALVSQVVLGSAEFSCGVDVSSGFLPRKVQSVLCSGAALCRWDVCLWSLFSDIIILGSL